LSYLIEAPTQDWQPVKVAQAYYVPPVPQETVLEVPYDPVANNCFLYVSQFVKLPLQALVVPNTVPSVGVVAIFQYKVPHYAVVEKLTEQGFWVKESNYVAGEYGTRFVKWNDPKIVGFFAPTSY
jgi:hypothetical protein